MTTTNQIDEITEPAPATANQGANKEPPRVRTRPAWAARWPRQLAVVVGSALINPIVMGWILLAVITAVAPGTGVAGTRTFQFVVIAVGVVVILLSPVFVQIKKTMAQWQGASNCWIDLAAKLPDQPQGRWWLTRLLTPERWRVYAYGVLGAILDWALSLAAFAWLALAFSEIYSAIQPRAVSLIWVWTTKPGGIFGSIFGWNPSQGGGAFFDPSWWMQVADGIVGLICLAIFVPIVAWCAKGQVGLTRLFLAPSAAETQRRLADVQIAKDSAAQAEASSMTRIERDLHDGPQQKLIGLGFDLATLQRRLESGNIEDAKVLTAAMKLRTEDILADIRLLSRGFAPPVLAERGLAEAVVALAAACPVPTTVDCDLPDNRLPDQVERAVYFAVSESLANVAKHASAASAQVRLSLADGLLSAQVTDDGVGGATMQPGHGLAGLVDRVAGVMGTLDITSDPDTGTTVSVVVPTD